MPLFGKNKADLRIEVEPQFVAPGHEITVRAMSEALDDKVQGGRVELYYTNRYEHIREWRDSDGDYRREQDWTQSDVQVVTVPLWDGPPTPGAAEVVIQMPDGVPPSIDRRVDWFLKVTIDRKRAMDVKEEVPLNVQCADDYMAGTARGPAQMSPEAPMQVTLDKRHMRFGDQLMGNLKLTPTKSFEARALRVQLVCERFEQDGISSRETFEQGLTGGFTLEPGRPLDMDFEMWVPHGGLPSHDAAYNGARWYFEAVVDRKLRSDEVTTLEVVVI